MCTLTVYTVGAYPWAYGRAPATGPAMTRAACAADAIMGVSFFRESAPQDFASFDRSFFAMCGQRGVVWGSGVEKVAVSHGSKSTQWGFGEPGFTESQNRDQRGASCLCTHDARGGGGKDQAMLQRGGVIRPRGLQSATTRSVTAASVMTALVAARS
jgi:hypothetical protein